MGLAGRILLIHERSIAQRAWHVVRCYHASAADAAVGAFAAQVHFRAAPGGAGGGAKMSGRAGADTIVALPPGTIVRRRDAGRDEPPLAELLEPGLLEGVGCGLVLGLGRCGLVLGLGRLGWRLQTSHVLHWRVRVAVHCHGFMMLAGS